MGTFKVNGDISATGNISASSFIGTLNGNALTATNSSKLGNYSATEYFRRGSNITTSCNDATTSRSYWATDTATDKPSIWGGLIDFNTGSHHQLFFSYGGNDTYVGLHTRAKVNGVWQPWSTFLNENNYTDYTVTKTGSGASGTWSINITGDAGTLNGYNHTQFLKAYDWWHHGDTSKHVNNLVNGSTFAYSGSHGSPTTGSILSFSPKDGSYATQIQGEYGSGTDFYFRTKNGDTGSWNPWRRMIHDGNISSQSVNYANSANYASSSGSSDYANSSGYATSAGYASSANRSTYAGTSWTATCTTKKWRRICYIATDIGIVGTAGILNIRSTRGNYVCNASFMITSAHPAGNSTIIQLGSMWYSTAQIRIVSDSIGNFYIEIHDNGDNVDAGIAQTYYCSWLPLTASSITVYTSATSGSTVPDGFGVRSSITIAAGNYVVGNLITASQYGSDPNSQASILGNIYFKI